MLDKDSAQRLVEEHINAEYWYHPAYHATGPLVIIEDKTIEKEYGWVFFFDTAPEVRAGQDDLSSHYSLKIDNFMLVLKSNGALHRTGPPFPTSYQPKTEREQHPVQLMGTPYMSPLEAIKSYERKLRGETTPHPEEQTRFSLPLNLQSAKMVARFYRNSLVVLMTHNLFKTPYVVFDEMTIEHDKGWFFWLGVREFYEKRTTDCLIHLHPFPPVPTLVFVDRATGFPEIISDGSAYGEANQFAEYGIDEIFDKKWNAFYRTLSGRWPDDWSQQHQQQ